jgi:hypothetical protein
MGSIIIRNRLDSNNPLYAKPGVGALRSTGLAPSPQIASTGTSLFAHGESFTVTSAALYGTKTTAAPWKWDPMDGSNNDTLEPRGTWLVCDELTLPRLSTARLRGTPGNTTTCRCPDEVGNVTGFSFGTRSSDISYTSASAANERTFPAPACFISCWLYVETNGTDGDNWKWHRWHGTTQTPNSYVGIACGEGTPCSVSNNRALDWGGLGVSSPSPDIRYTDIVDGWHQWQFYFNASTNVWVFWFDGSRRTNSTSFTPAFTYFNWLFEMQTLNKTVAVVNQYWDDMYIDDIAARVEVGNNATYNSCTHREMQIPTSWGASAVTFTVNRGTFGASDAVWVHVINSSNTVVQSTPYTFGQSY